MLSPSDLLSYKVNHVLQPTPTRWNKQEIQSGAASVNLLTATASSARFTKWQYITLNNKNMGVQTPRVLPQPNSIASPHGNTSIIDIRSVIYDNRAR